MKTVNDDDDDENKRNIADDKGVDWTDTLGPPKNQGGCGSCWAFAAVGAAESAYYRRTKQKIPGSEQAVLDCSDGLNGGCHGGSQNSALKWLARNGVNSQVDYPYRSNKGPCQKKKYAYTLKGLEGASSSEASWFGQIKKGAMAVIIQAAGPFFHYRSGVLNYACTRPNHAVVAVGYGFDDKKQRYIIVRNSWGAGWGEHGYFRILYTTDNHHSCYVTDHGMLAL